jgi:O-succinylbenzoate synthase
MLFYSKVSLPLIKEFRTSFGTEKNRNALIFILREGEMEAYGEAVTEEDPLYGYEDNYSVMYVVRKYLVDIIKSTKDPEKFMERAERIKGHLMAKAAIEMMLWDYVAKEEEKPLHKFIGHSKGEAEVGISIGMSSIEDMLNSVRSAVNSGYKRIKVKIEKGYDIEILKAIRENFPHINLSVDANQAYSRDDFKIIEEIDNFNLAYIEQPFQLDDLNGHAFIRKRIQTPLCLDESITTVRTLRNAIELGAVDIINIKPGRVGGIGSSINLMEDAKENDIGIWIGGMLETGIGRSFNISLASQKYVNMPGDTSPNSRYFKKDITNEKFEMIDGKIKPYESPGIGVSLDYRFVKMNEMEGGRLID